MHAAVNKLISEEYFEFFLAICQILSLLMCLEVLIAGLHTVRPFGLLKEKSTLKNPHINLYNNVTFNCVQDFTFLNDFQNDK